MNFFALSLRMTQVSVQDAAREINFKELMQRLLGLLTEKEQNILERRFSLGKHKRETLDKIGQSYAITRERVRQIESVAIKKLARISMDPAMRLVHDLAEHIIAQNGDIYLETLLVESLSETLKGSAAIDQNSVKLALKVSKKFILQDKNTHFRPCWRLAAVPLRTLQDVDKAIHTTLKKQQDNVLTATEIAERIDHVPDATPERVASLLEIDTRFIRVAGGWGLASCRLINPKSIKDRILVTLRHNNQEAMHFRDIITHVLEDFAGQKQVTPQAIHNELIRHEEFVLVGRGQYGLKEWGMVEGTVCDVIKAVLEENDGPLKRQDIIQRVLAKRDIRVGTISLNLQKYPFFERVGRAIYTYNAELDTRRRNKKNKA